MSEETKGRDFCPTCFPLGHRLEDRVEKLTEKNAALEKEAAEAEQLRAQLAEALKPKPQPAQDIPDFADVIRHCEDGSCSAHAKQLQDYRLKVAEDVVTNLTKPENKAKLTEIMKAAGVTEMPNKIVISGVRRA